MLYVRFPLSLRNVEDLLHERGIDICHETVCYWWNRFDPIFSGEIRKSASLKCEVFASTWPAPELLTIVKSDGPKPDSILLKRWIEGSSVW